MLFLLVSSPLPQSNNWWAFLACMFCFPNLGYVMFSREFAFCLFWNCTCIYTWIGRNLKKTVFWGNITWSEIKWGNKKYKPKGPIQNLSIGCVFSCFIVFGSFEQWSVLKWGSENNRVWWEYAGKQHMAVETCHTLSSRFSLEHLHSLP